MKISSAGKVGYWCKARENLFIQCQVWGEKFIAQLLIAIEDLQSDIELLTDFSWLSKHFLGIAESIKEMHQLTRKGPFVSFDVSWRKFAMCFFNFFGEMILTRIPQLKRRAYHLLSAISLLHSNEGPALETSCFTIFLRFMNSLDETQCLCLTSQPTRTTTFFIWPKCSNVSLFGSSSAPGGGGVLLGIPSGGVPSGSPNPDPLPDQNIWLFAPIFRPGLSWKSIPVFRPGP